MNSIFIRRSVRQYKAQPVEREKVEQLLKAAMQAPSAGNQRPWEFVVIEDRKTLAEMAGMSPYAGPVARAPLAIVLLANEAGLRFPEYWQQDLAAATQNLLLAAAELDLGAVWLGVAPLQDRMGYITKLLCLPGNILPFAVVPIGYPAEANSFANRYEPGKIYYEKYTEAAR